MNIIDTHCHLYSEQFCEDLDQVIERAKQNHLAKIILPNIDEESFQSMMDLHAKDPDFFAMGMGIHPCSVKQNYSDQLSWVESELQTGKYIAVGEIGIDLYWDQSLQKEQTEAFREQIRLAKKHDLPIIIHARDSMQEIFAVLDEEMDDNLKGVFHCFLGEEMEIQKVKSYGSFYFGLGGVLTFKNSSLKNFIDSIPMDKIILETDAPYLAPVPYRGKRNEPSYTRNVAQYLADIKLMELEQIAEITSNNAKTLFNI
ncbi:MAG: TatD family hydrolase [Crocinitomicaceae bacterium]|nr:TatD family hydrolase [Crocinitomicaceae bacterium]